MERTTSDVDLDGYDDADFAQSVLQSPNIEAGSNRMLGLMLEYRRFISVAPVALQQHWHVGMATFAFGVETSTPVGLVVPNALYGRCQTDVLTANADAARRLLP